MPEPPAAVIEDGDDDFVSRSQRKREALAVFDLAEALVALTPTELSVIPMSDDLRDLVLTSRTITAQIARKRQLQFLAKQMRRREDEIEAIRIAVEHQQAAKRGESSDLHRLEALRAQLIDGGDEALNSYIATHPRTDRQQLRQLIRRARDEREKSKPPAAARELFRLLREIDSSL